MARAFATLALVALPLVAAQQIGAPENRPPLKTWRCTSRNGCVEQDTSVVLDAGTHWIHEVDSETGCTTSDGTLDPDLCPDKETCAANCVIEGIDDYTPYGVTTSGGDLILKQYLQEDGELKAASPRVYLVDEDGETYSMLQLLNQEFTFEVDVSNLPCGMNGALYFSEMLEDGGRSDLNPAGATYGTGYCDAQCFTIPWINGAGNVDGHGSCCNEMDIWEANARSQSYTPHACDATALYECTGDECGEDGVCDKPGCGFNPYALGDKNYYGYDLVVDTTKPFTVVTQFLTNDNSTTGTLVEIRRLYIQDGQVIQNAAVESPAGTGTADSLTDPYCEATSPIFQRLGGLEQMGRSIGSGMVLAMSIWNDAGSNMQWLDGGSAGPCNATEGAPSFIEAHTPDTAVTFSNIRWGDINSTFGRNARRH